MKLSDELKETEKRFLKLSQKHDLQAYADAIKQSGDFKNFEIRLANDFMHAVYKCGELCNFYDKYNCNDSHITTLAIKAMKALNLKY